MCNLILYFFELYEHFGEIDFIFYLGTVASLLYNEICAVFVDHFV